LSNVVSVTHSSDTPSTSWAASLGHIMPSPGRLDERSQTIAATTLTFLIHRVYQTLRELNHRGLDDLATDLHQAVNDYENTFRKATR
jgi:hypothetical protein